ncbi:MAG: DUF6029 family protein [Alistipes sp.]|nr:DUF6029 family protein [Alistipes sp.]
MKKLLLFMLTLGCMASASAQIQFGKDGKGGQLAGSVETNSIYYLDDSKLGDAVRHWGSNTYVKLDYTLDRFSVGAQADLYLPALQGYEIGNYKRMDSDYMVIPSSLYVQWQDRNYGFRLGSIYEQLGNGLIFRAYEDRQLGINSALMGAHARVNLGRYVAVKAFTGRQRLYDKYADNQWVTGADLSLSLSEIFGANSFNLALEGSYVNRNQSLTVKEDNSSFIQRGMDDRNVHLWSGRVNFDMKSFYLHAEYAGKTKDLATVNAMEATNGYATFVEAGYNKKSFSISGQARVLENMGALISLYGEGSCNTMNYLPAITRQYTYMLANLEPHQVNVEGEIAGQVDVYYTLRNKSDRRKFWNFHANYSTAYTLNGHQSVTGERELLWRDVNFDIERQWNKSWKTTFLYSFQERNPYHGAEHRTYVANIFVADVTYKINRKHSLRWELQYLLTDEYEGDWIAALIEYNFAPRWSIFFQDMYNHQRVSNSYNANVEKINYYSGGFSFTYNRSRLQLSYGRNRAGYVCSGGVCRYTPAYTGVNLLFTTSF